MVEQNQQFIYNSEELSLIKNTFAENEPLLYIVRKVFLQFPLSKDELVHLKSAINDDVVTILKKRILPDLSDDFPLGQIPSMMTTLTDHLRSKDVGEMEAQFDSKVQQEEYLNQQFTALEAILAEKAVPKPTVVLADLGKIAGKSPEQAYIDMTSYLFLLGYIDPSFIMIKAIAGEKDETIEQQKERMTRNSSK